MFRFTSRFAVLAASVAVACLAAAPLGKPIATVTGTGQVTVGAASLKATGVQSWPVLAGDRISTNGEGSALVSSASMGRIEIRNNSKVTVTEDHVSLQQGAVGSESLPVRSRDFTVSVKDEAARNWFVVSDQEGEVLVAAHRGDVYISRAGAAPLLLPAGSYAMPAPAPKKKDDDDDDERKGGAATAGSTAGWTIGSLSHAKSVALAVGIGAAGATGAVVGLTGDGPKSRSVIQ